SPAQNAFQAISGRNLDPYSDEFGDDLSWGERGTEVLSGISKCLPMLAETKPVEVVAFAVGAGSQVGEAVVDELVANQALDNANGAYVKAVLKLGGLAGQVSKGWAGPDLALS